MSSDFLCILRGLLLALSFIGLCATARNSLKLDRFVAPFFTACSIIVLLMLGGMLRVLPYVFFAVYIGGFAGLVWTYFVRRVRPDFALIALLAAYAIYLVLRFYPCPLFRNDDVSHWGLVARYLLRHDAFPDASTDTVFFQSYPLGAASFIYYVCRTIENTEGLWLVAQNLLMGLFMLPVLAHIKGNRRFLYPVAAVLYVYLFKHTRILVNLQVDWLIGFFAIGIVAALTHCADDLKKAVWIGLPAAVAMVWIKSSGLFFALLAVILMVRAARCAKAGRKTEWKIAILGVAVFALAYLAWTFHVRLSYPAGMNTKHAVSLSAYLSEASGKGFALVSQIAKMMLLELIPRQFYKLTAWAMLFGTGVLCALIARFRPALRKELRSVRNELLAALAIYAVWYVMLFFMYVFSMPTGEASELASFYRYNATGLILMTGMSALTLFRFVSRKEVQFAKWIHAAFFGVLALCAVAIPVLGLHRAFFFEELLVPETELPETRAALQEVLDELPAKSGGNYLTYLTEDTENLPPSTLYYMQKYELDTARVFSLIRLHEPVDGVTHALYSAGLNEPAADPVAYAAEHMDEYDAFIILHRDPEFESSLNAFLETYTGDTPVIIAGQ